MTTSILLVSLLFLGISMLVSGVLKGKFNTYGRIRLSANLTGREIAEKMLRDNGIYDVKVISAQGFLSDHYNPANKTVTSVRMFMKVCRFLQPQWLPMNAVTRCSMPLLINGLS